MMRNSHQKINPPLRDTLMSATYFNDWIEWYSNTAIKGKIEHVKTEPVRDPKCRAQFIFQIFILHYELLLLRYSCGDEVGELRDFFPQIVDAWEWAYAEEIKVFSTDEMAGRKRFDRNLDIYVVCVWLVSLALCLKVDDALFARILKLCGNEGSDWLFELLAGARVKGRQSAPALCYPKTYGWLKLAVEAQGQAERERLMKAFLQRWYASLSKTYWYDNHKGPDGGGYFGYWCFEVAGVVQACGFDDRALRDLPHYPKDLAAPFSAI